MVTDPDRLRIVHYPAPALRETAREVDPADDEVRRVARRMLELMHEAEGVGLAGPQVGLPWRLFVTNARDADPEDRVFINPVLKVGEGTRVSAEEGCLSLPDIHIQVRRIEVAEITACDLEGKQFTRQGTGMLARIWQHEHDHLEGVLIIDRMSPMERLQTRKVLKELRMAAAAG